MLKGLVNRLLRSKPITDDGPMTLIAETEEEQSLEEHLKVIKHSLQGSGVLDRLSDILNQVEIEFEALNAELNHVRETLVPPRVASTVRIIRWDGKVVSQRGTVVSKHRDSFIINTMTGEYAIEVVVTSQPQELAKFRILWIGLDYAGKTTLLHKLRYNEYIKPKRTVGQELEDVIMEGLQITNIDLGGQKALRQHWSRFPLVPQIIVFVIDILDEERFDEAYEELEQQVITNERYDQLPLLILVNKIDEYQQSLDPVEYITDNIDLLSLLHDRTWQLKAVSALTGEGLDEVIEILTKFLLQAETV